MATPSLSREQADQTISVINDCYRDGFSVSGHPSANTEAARRLGVNRGTLRDRIKSAKRLYNIEPDATLAKSKLVDPDEIETDRRKIIDRDLAADNKRLRERLVEAEDIRAGVLRLIDPPLRPRIHVQSEPRKAGARTVIIHLSDWHCGEVVDLDEMEGLNSFNLDIFRARVGRLTTKATDLLTTHWKGKPPEKIIVIFGGDLITGEIHNELAKTNDALSAPAVRECAETLAGFVKALRQIAPIDIYSLPGNHGRLTLKPESKGMAANSFDTLIGQVVEMVISINGVKGVRFFYPKSGDAIFKVYGLTFVAAHGDRIGSRGGQGFLGAVATILRGIAKTRSYYAAQGIIVDYVLVGHFHTTSKLPRGFSNGSLVGASEYSRDLKADPEEAKQNMIVIHNELGVVDYRELKCGDAKEGAIYRPRVA